MRMHPAAIVGWRRERGSWSRSAGMTLLELILVMFIMAVVLGGGLGLFASIDPGRGAAAGLVRNVVRSAQNTAIARQAPASVSIDAESGTLTAHVLQVVGTWHFEHHRLDGGNDLGGQVNRELFVPDGYMGEALSFTERVGEVAAIPVDVDPAFDFTDGFAIECVLRHEGVGGGRALSISDHVRLELGKGGVLRASFRAKTRKDGNEQKGGNVIVQSGPGVISPEHWTRVRVSYDRREFALAVEGVVVASVQETAPVWAIDGPLVLSDEHRTFPGSIDNLVISAVQSDTAAVLPDTVRIRSAPAAIHFAAGGGLDRTAHPQPAEITLEFDDGTQTVVGVGFYGTVE